MADHVAIDISLLRETGSRLGRVAQSLGQARGSGADDAEAVRQRDLAEAMEEFTRNWKRHREHLIDKVSGGAKFVTGAVEAYERLEGDLTAGLGDVPGRAR
jgi:hypothetical protein